MVALRYTNCSTSDNVRVLCDIVRDPKCEEVILFATVDRDPSTGERDNNMPLVAAIAIYSIPGIDKVHVVFDGMFLTAARYPRYLEVRDLLDLAQDETNVYFSERSAPLTSSLTPEEAVAVLSDMGGIRKLDASSRADYFSLLSSFTEQQIVDIHKV